MTPPVEGAALRAALEASCLRGALPPVDLPIDEEEVSDESKKAKTYLEMEREDIRAVCLVLAIVEAFVLMEFDG